MDMEMPLPLFQAQPSARGLWARLMRAMLRDLAVGAITVWESGATLLHGEGAREGPRAGIHLHRRRAILDALLGGEHGAARSFIAGRWSSPNLVDACRFFARNPPAPASALVEAPRRLLERARHALNANTRRGSRRNIEFHYDLGNDFFRLWLDEAMAYSSGLWGEPGETLEMAQRAKFSRVAELLGDINGRAVLEIGCGWGAQAQVLAERGAAVKGITLSPAQLAHAREAIAETGLNGRVDLALEDYRDQQGQYDAIVSIEMAEAVGEANLPGYFATIHRNLKPGGIAVLQVITIAEDRLDSYRRQPDFIQRFIFPGGFLPSRGLLLDLAGQAGLALRSEERFGLSYARTLAAWRQRFEAAWPDIAKLGFDERFRRLWTYYLCYCEAGFLEGAVDVGLYVLSRPDDTPAIG